MITTTEMTPANYRALEARCVSAALAAIDAVTRAMTPSKPSSSPATPPYLPRRGVAA